MTPKEFVEKLYPYAKAVEENKGISAEFILAQAALESGWGKYCPGNMYFGIKANKGYEGKKQLLKTFEYFKSEKEGYRFPEVIRIEFNPKLNRYKYIVRDWFRAYNTPEGSFLDHADFFYKNSRYHEALKDACDADKFAEGIAKAGYSTSPTYAKTLKDVIQIVRKYTQK